jgi:rhodanese-related sulfurtransferase
MALSKTMRDFVQDALKSVEEILPEAVQRRLHHGDELVLLDVREGEEFQRGHLPDALLIPRGVLEGQAPQLLRDTDTEIIVYCGSGMRSALACDVMQQMGYTNVHSMAGGFRAWVQFGGRLEH